MMRSPSLALSPVVSVSSTTRRVIGDASVCELVGSFVFWMPSVSLDPMPLYLMLRAQLVEVAPQVLVFYRFLVSRFPALAFPGVDPARDALLHILGIGEHPHAARALQRLQAADHGGQLHAVVGGGRFAAPQLFFVPAQTDDDSPAAGAGIAAARPLPQKL